MARGKTPKRCSHLTFGQNFLHPCPLMMLAWAQATSKGLGSKPRLQLKDLKRIRRSLTMDNPNLLPPPLPLPNISPRTDELEGPFTGAEEELPAVQFDEPERLGLPCIAYMHC